MSQPPTGPPGPPPWGAYPDPTPPAGRGNGWKVLCGAVIGVVATVVLPFLGLGVADSLGFGGFVLSFVVVPVVGVSLLFSDTTRPWGTGLLIGWTVAWIVAAGACVALLSSLG
jgi:hypothetical protein